MDEKEKKDEVTYEKRVGKTQAGEKLIEVISRRPPSPNQKDKGGEER